MNVNGMPASKILNRSFSLQTVSQALLKSNSVNAERYIGNHLLLPGLYERSYFAAPEFTEPSLESAEQHFRLCDVVKTISKNSFEKWAERRNFTW